MHKFYITSAIPYVNAKPHIGHALEFVQTDVVARYYKSIGDEVLKLCGGDENALKNVQAAEKANLPIQEFIDLNNNLFIELSEKLNAKYDVWQKGSDKKRHFVSSQYLWEKCNENGDIYKKSYEGLYCVGCETFYEKEDLDKNGECFEHPGKKLENVTEENYFFKLSKYQAEIIKLIKNNTLKIIPEKRKNEVLSFLEKGLQDISISRSNLRAKNWGVPIPNDDTQRMYVWFDALNIYQSGIGFGSEKQSDIEMYKKWWPADTHVIGKGILRFHAIYWIAFLLSSKLELPKKILVHEYFTVNGQKMSKTLGNVIDPIELINKYGADSLRLYFLKYFSLFSDGDFSEKKFIEAYNADLANGLGNLIARVAMLCEKANFTQMTSKTKQTHVIEKDEYSKAMIEFRFNDALNFIWNKIADLDKFINEEKPWTLLKTQNSKVLEILRHSVDQIQEIAILLDPFMPETTKLIQEQFNKEKIVSQKSLFPRIIS